MPRFSNMVIKHQWAIMDYNNYYQRLNTDLTWDQLKRLITNFVFIQHTCFHFQCIVTCYEKYYTHTQWHTHTQTCGCVWLPAKIL